jgi:hypothetical protein
MKVENMKVHYIILSDGTELIGRTPGPSIFGYIKVWDTCVILMPSDMSERPRIRKWVPWTEDPDDPIILSTITVTTSFPVNKDLSDWYDASVEAINKRTDVIQTALDEIGKNVTEDEFIESMDDIETDSEFDELLMEFFGRNTRTIH